MKRWNILGGVVVALAAAAAVGVPIVEERLAEQVRAGIAQRGAAKVAQVEIGLLKRRLVIEGLDVAIPGGNSVKAARLDASGLSWPLADMLEGRTPFSGWTWGDPLHADRLEVTDFEYSTPVDGVWRVGKLVLEGLDLPRHAPIAEPQDDSHAAQFLALSQLTLRRLELRDGTHQERGHYGAQARVPEMVLEAFDKGLVGRLAVNGFEYREMKNSPSASLRVGEVALRKLDVRPVLERLKDPEWVLGMPTGRAALEELIIDGVGGDALERQGIALGRISFDYKFDGKVGQGRSRIESFQFKPRGFGGEDLQLRMLMLSLGLQEVKASLDCTVGEDRPKGEVTLDRCLLASPGLADLEWSFSFINADEIFWRAYDEGDMFLMLTSKLALGSA
ncbi:MAG TPA: hypothetical protein VEC14_12410, partial [Reyranellaceae bacterium]|nr:hypothetical protein [Reyranellaceae bacterium]